MRCAVVADIHSNLEAFQAVLADHFNPEAAAGRRPEGQPADVGW